jgi:hypothetical protein
MALLQMPGCEPPAAPCMDSNGEHTLSTLTGPSRMSAWRLPKYEETIANGVKVRRGVLSSHNEDVVLDVRVVLAAHHLTDALNGV